MKYPLATVISRSILVRDGDAWRGSSYSKHVCNIFNAAVDTIFEKCSNLSTQILTETLFSSEICKTDQIWRIIRLPYLYLSFWWQASVVRGKRPILPLLVGAHITTLRGYVNCRPWFSLSEKLCSHFAANWCWEASFKRVLHAVWQKVKKAAVLLSIKKLFKGLDCRWKRENAIALLELPLTGKQMNHLNANRDEKWLIGVRLNFIVSKYFFARKLVAYRSIQQI